jgi:GDP/UDP-N,N'-diacetylbacillosamine 2-epimerase (hydrolysing)
MSRKICVITGSRAEYGLLRWIMQGIKDDADLSLQIIATGMHLSPEFGLTTARLKKTVFRLTARLKC